ncbi:MAG: hypothetical protein SGJ19_05175 [Planctomycetia bacterium]|nr:hypothetical protein [Planctomycetia bacterium]
MANKPTIQLAKVFKEALKAAGRTQIGFADSIQVDRSQFRVHLKRNTFSIEETEAIADFLEVGRERLAERFDFAVATQRQESRRSPAKVAKENVRLGIARNIRSKSTDLQSGILDLYRALDEDDLVVICSVNLLPLELTPGGWNLLRDAWISAVKRGCCFVYIRPADTVLERISNARLHGGIDGARVAADHLKMRQSLMAVDLSKKDIDSRVHLIATEWCPFWAWNMRFGFYSVVTSEGRRERELFGRFPFGGPSANRDLLLYTDIATCDSCIDYLVHEFDQSDKLRALLPRL